MQPHNRRHAQDGGAALLIAGYDPVKPGRPAVAASTLGRIGEALLASETPWRVRRLAPTGGRRDAPDRLSLKRELDRWSRQETRTAFLVIAGRLVDASGERALIAGADGDHQEYPDDATLSLSWLAGCVCRAKAASAFVLLALHSRDRPDSPGRGLLDRLEKRPEDLVVVQLTEDGDPSLDVLLEGLHGAAVDPATGTITNLSLASHLQRGLGSSEVRPPQVATSLMAPVPLGRIWNLGWSRLATLPPEVPFDPASTVGTVLPGQFRLDAVVASGGFGTVYRARQLSVDRDVAIKVLHRVVDPASEVGRLFVHEVQAAGRLDHPNVVRVYQADVDHQGRLFFAMELLVGRDIQQIVREQTFDRERAVGITLQLLDALGAAHDAGLIHADIKPANILVVPGREQERVVLVDFGLARLRAADRASRAAGGTPAYMAPEQLNEGRVDPRSDIFAAGLVLVTMLTGWIRRRADELVPPLDSIEDPSLRRVLERALALDPAGRFGTAAEFAAALSGGFSAPPGVAERPPFQHLLPFTERDHGRLYGRERDLGHLTEHALYRRATIFTAPSGAGKTSLLRAGLVPRLSALNLPTRYLSCRDLDADETRELATAIHRSHERLVVILDHLEAWLADTTLLDERPLDKILPLDGWPVDVSLVLSVREDFLPRLLGHDLGSADRLPVLRIGPLGLEGARDAIRRPLAESRLTIEGALLERLLDDLALATRTMNPELKWGPEPCIYPPHLQLACSVLYQALRPGQTEMTLHLYDELGGLAAIVGEHLDRVLDTELGPSTVVVAREVFKSLVTSFDTRAALTEDELLVRTAAGRQRKEVVGVLETLRMTGLLVRIANARNAPTWELAHDSLLPRIRTWIDRQDLARRQAMELLRHHLRHSGPRTPSLLSRAELREVQEHPGMIDELEDEWRERHRPGPDAPPHIWTPRRLVARSRQIRRRITAAAILLALTSVSAVSAAVIDRRRGAAEREREELLRSRDLGRVVFELSPFEWAPQGSSENLIAIPASQLPALSWTLHAPDPNDPSAAGPALDAALAIRGSSSFEGRIRVDQVEAPGGPAFLVIDGRGRHGESCRPSVVPLRRLPGYALRERGPPRIHISVPSCRASSTDMVEIPAGTFVRGGLGEPPSPFKATFPHLPPEMVVDLPRFRIDRTEVSNTAFAAIATMDGATGIQAPAYPGSRGFRQAAGPSYPVAGILWSEARAYCRYLGKELPTTAEWEKSMRGGLTIAGRPNPMPRRNLPWGLPIEPVPARVHRDGMEAEGPAPVGSTPGDISPYGVLDLAGNVNEWTDSLGPDLDPAFRVVRGGYWGDDAAMPDLIDLMAIDNPRSIETRTFALGFRCVAREPLE